MMGGTPTVQWRGITTDPESAKCWEAAATDPSLRDVLIQPIPGYGSYRSNAASAGTDSGGGHVDINLVPFTNEQRRRIETVFRRYGNAAFWRPARRADGTRYGWQEHLHVLRIDCADLAPNARTQLKDYAAGWSGLPIGGRTLRDSGTRSWVGHRWAAVKASMAKTQVGTGSTPPIGGPITPPQEPDVKLSDIIARNPNVTVGQALVRGANAYDALFEKGWFGARFVALGKLVAGLQAQVDALKAEVEALKSATKA